MRKLMLFICSICICILSSFSNVSALDQYYTWMPKPSDGDGNGWLVLLVENKSTGGRYIHTFSWSNLCAEGDSYDINTSYVDLSISAHNIGFTAYGSTANCNFSLFQYATSSLVVRKSVVYNGPNGSNFSLNYASDHYIIGFMCGGNVGTVDSLISSPVAFEVNWGGTVDAERVADILDELTRMGIVLDEVSVNFEVALAYFDSILSEQIKSNNWLSKIFSKVTDLYNYFVGNDESNNSVEENNSSNNDLNNSINEYDQIESALTDNFNSSISNLDTNIGIFDVSDFNSTSLFLSQQLTNIFNINPNIQNMIMYSLIMGFAFVLIGIGVKR